MLPLVFIVLVGAALIMFANGVGLAGWGAFVIIGGFFSLCAMAAE